MLRRPVEPADPNETSVATYVAVRKPRLTPTQGLASIVTMFSTQVGRSHAATRVHRTDRRSGSVAGCGAGAAVRADLSYGLCSSFRSYLLIEEGQRHPVHSDVFSRTRAVWANYVEGRNLAVNRYSGVADDYADIAREVVGAEPDVIVTVTSRMVLALQASSSTIPIVASTGDPIAEWPCSELGAAGRQLYRCHVRHRARQLFKTARPTERGGPNAFDSRLSCDTCLLGKPAWLGDARRSSAFEHPTRSRLARTSRRGRLSQRIRGDGAKARRRCAHRRSSRQHFTHRRLIAELAEENRLPTMGPWLDIMKVGGLMAYAPDNHELFRYLASCVDRILRGEKPGEIPILQSARFKLSINLKTAQALGLVIPASLVARADEVIE